MRNVASVWNILVSRSLVTLLLLGEIRTLPKASEYATLHLTPERKASYLDLLLPEEAASNSKQWDCKISGIWSVHRVNLCLFFSHSAVYSGQHGLANASFATAIGSFAKATDAGSLVLTARNSQGNAVLLDDTDPSFHCYSKGENTVHICSGESGGVFVNDANLEDELGRIPVLKSEIATLEEKLENLTASILPECIPGNEGSRRRILADCFGSKLSPNDPTGFIAGVVAGIATAIVVIVTLGLLYYRLSKNEKSAHDTKY